MRRISIFCVAVLAVSAALGAPRVARTIRPEGVGFTFNPGLKTFLPLNDDYRVELDGREVEVRACRESCIPFNRYWPGRQRPLDQTERASYLAFEAEGAVSCSVKAKWACEKTVIRPLSAGIRPVVTNGVFRDIAVYAEHGVPNPGIDVTAHVKTENGANPFENIVLERFSINGKIVDWREFSFKTNAPVRLRDEK